MDWDIWSAVRKNEALSTSGGEWTSDIEPIRDQNVTGCSPESCPRRSLQQSSESRRSSCVHRFVGLHDIHSDPSRSYFAEAHVIGADFFCRFHRESITSRPVVDRKD